jgi:cell division protease FtsH
MSAKVGSISLGSGNVEPFLGRELATHRDISNEMAQTVDSEIRAILDSAMNEAHRALTVNRSVLDRLAEELLEKETLNQDQIAEIFKGLKKLPKRATWRSSQKRGISGRGPITVPERPEEKVSKQKA